MLNNLSSGVIDLRSATINTGFSGAGTINNAGELKKTLNTSVQEVFVSPVFSNQTNGIVTLNSGTLTVNGVLSQAGTIEVAAGATFQNPVVGRILALSADQEQLVSTPAIR
ncbi:MAG: hypothetical protein IPP41_04280 [Rhodocyclaceae bacterium]|nr:hypothetical protein [Rhodocyclaceae bacterium]